jgi:hypothetical protein
VEGFEMNEPIEIKLPKWTGYIRPETGQPSDTVQYRADFYDLEFRVEDGRIRFRSGEVCVERVELKSVRKWRNFFRAKPVWVIAKRFDKGEIRTGYVHGCSITQYSSRENRLLSQDKLESIATTLLERSGHYFDTDFLDWLLSPVEDKLNEILRELNAQVSNSKRVVKLAA